jgi:hypothetical protein
MCNPSLNTGVLPDPLKISIVKPLNEKGDKNCTINYRPILLSNVSSILLENVMHSRLSQHLCINSILVPEQFGLRKGIFTENAAYMLTTGVFKSLN